MALAWEKMEIAIKPGPVPAGPKNTRPASNKPRRIEYQRDRRQQGSTSARFDLLPSRVKGVNSCATY